MSAEEIKSRLQAELPALLQQDAGFRRWLEDLIRATAASTDSVNDRFDRALRELAADREAQARKWEPQDRKWDEQQRFNRDLLEELRQTRIRQEQGIGAIGARWGLRSEASFRDALVISPMVRPEARPVAERLGIEIFGYAEDTTGLAAEG